MYIYIYIYIYIYNIYICIYIYIYIYVKGIFNVIGSGSTVIQVQINMSYLLLGRKTITKYH